MEDPNHARIQVAIEDVIYYLLVWHRSWIRISRQGIEKIVVDHLDPNL